jgi:hypothetical protein
MVQHIVLGILKILLQNYLSSTFMEETIVFKHIAAYLSSFSMINDFTKLSLKEKLCHCIQYLINCIYDWAFSNLNDI